MSARILALALAPLVAISLPAEAADLSPSRLAPTAATSWAGFYLGATVGGVLSNTSRVSGSYALFDPFVAAGAPASSLRNTAGGFAGGAQLGYNFQPWGAGGPLVGLETDLSSTDVERRSLAATGTPAAGFSTRYRTRLEALGTVRGRLGYAFGPTLAYATGGFAYALADRLAQSYGPTGQRFGTIDIDSMEVGYAAGVGLEYLLPADWFGSPTAQGAVTLRAEYLHYSVGHASTPLRIAGAAYEARLRNEGDLVRTGLNYRF